MLISLEIVINNKQQTVYVEADDVNYVGLDAQGRTVVGTRINEDSWFLTWSTVKEVVERINQHKTQDTTHAHAGRGYVELYSMQIKLSTDEADHIIASLEETLRGLSETSEWMRRNNIDGYEENIDQKIREVTKLCLRILMARTP